jgi:quercetin dioxygenase-like cupin family protein
VRRLLLIPLVLALPLLVAVGAALSAGEATAPQPTGGVVGTGVLTFGSQTVQFSSAKGYVMEWGKVPPGAKFPWHIHRTTVVVQITKGALTLYDVASPQCGATTYSAGQGFVEPPNHIHYAINQGKTAVFYYAVYVGVPANWRKNPTPLDVFVKAPTSCPATVQAAGK